MLNRAKSLFRWSLVRCVDLGFIKSLNPKVAYICEKQDWVIHWEGKSIASRINSVARNNYMLVTHKVHLVRSPIIHFGSQYMWEIWKDLIPPKTIVIVNFYHGKPSDGTDVAKHIVNFIKNNHKINLILVANSIVFKRLIDWGIPKNKIKKIFLGVDSNLFFNHDSKSKLIIRHELGLDQNSLVIGSFQKDGVGWKSGRKPKLIKGPDIFTEVLRIISITNKITVLLTGPSRGYVVSRLKKFGIEYKHVQLKDYSKIPIYYQALDCYLITSREEGGPKGLVESIASGIPVLTTPVGMAYDVLDKSQIFSSFDPIEIASELNAMLEAKTFQAQINTKREIIEKINFDQIAQEHLTLYSELTGK